MQHLASGSEKLTLGEAPDKEAEETWIRTEKVKNIRTADKQKQK